MKNKAQQKLIIAFLLISATFFSIPVAASTEDKKITFSDVSQKDPFYNSVSNLVNSGIMTCQQLNKKTMVGKFNPYGTISEAEFLSLIAKVVCTPEEIENTTPLFDIKYVQATEEKGIVSQCELNHKCNDCNGTPEIADPITRETAAAYLTRADFYLTREYKYPIIQPGRIKDFNKVAYEYRITVLKACSLGFFRLEKECFKPTARLNRAEAAIYINRLIDKTARVKVDLKDALTYEQINAVQAVEAKNLYTDKENPYRYTGPYAKEFYEHDKHLEIDRKLW